MSTCVKEVGGLQGFRLTSKFMEMGGRAHFFLSLVGSSSISALICDSFIPAIRLILQKKLQKLAQYVKINTTSVSSQLQRILRKIFYLYVKFQSLEFTVLSEYIYCKIVSKKAKTS